MGENPTIEQPDASWSPVRGCTKVSPGCKHCYACTFAERFLRVENLSALEIEHGFKKAVR